MVERFHLAFEILFIDENGEFSKSKMTALLTGIVLLIPSLGIDAGWITTNAPLLTILGGMLWAIFMRDSRRKAAARSNGGKTVT